MRWLLYTFLIGLFIQIMGLVSLSRSFSLSEGKLSFNASAIRIADSSLTLSRFMPHRWVDSVIPGKSKVVRLLEIADSTAQVLSVSKALSNDSQEFLSLKDLLNSESLKQVSTISREILPIQENILLLLQGKGGQDVIEEIRNVPVLSIVKASRSLLELGLISEAISGCKSPARVLVLFTSDSELRSVGGLIGQFAVVEVKCDEFSIVKVGTNSELSDNINFHKVHQEFPGLYSGVNNEWVNSNLLPTGSDLGRAWIASYESQFTDEINGVIVLDTQFLAAIAELKGGIQAADGTILQSKDEVSAYLRNGIYFQYPEDQIARKEHLIQVTNSIADSLGLEDLADASMFDEYKDLVLDNRLYIAIKEEDFDSDVKMLNWSSRSKNDIYIGFNNLSGSKFDYYSKIKINHSFCSNNKYILEIAIENDAKAGAYYPDYVGRRLDSYPSKEDGVLSQILISYPAKGVRVFENSISPFSSSRQILGESQNRNLLSVTEFVSAGEKYSLRLTFRSKEDLYFKSWGKSYASEARSECA